MLYTGGGWGGTVNAYKGGVSDGATEGGTDDTQPDWSAKCTDGGDLCGRRRFKSRDRF